MAEAEPWPGFSKDKEAWEKGEGQEGELKYEGYKYVIEDDEIEDDDAESVDSVDTFCA